MEKILLKTWLLLACLLLGVGSAWAEKITDYSNIVSGKKYYIGATTGTTDYYLSVDGSQTSTSIAGTAVTDNSNGTVFVFEGSGTSWTIKFDGTSNYLGLKSSKDNGKVQVVSSAATFTASNQSGKIRLTIGDYSIQKNNSGTQFGSYGNTQTDVWLEEVSSTPVTKYNVTVDNNIANGTVTANYSSAAEGTTVTLKATPDSGYELYSWNVTDASSNAITVTNNQFTMPAANVNVSATFVPEPTNVVFDLTTDNTTTATETEMSWVTAQVSIVAEKSGSTTATNNYYPGTVGKNYSSTRFYTNSTLTFTPASGVTIIKVVYTATSTNYATALQGSAWTNASAAVDGTTVTITPTDGTQAISATIGSNTGASSIKVFYSGEAAPITNTIDFYAAGTDGYYTTFSNDKAVTIPSAAEVDDEYVYFTVSTVWADGNELVFENLEEQDGLYYLSENEGYIIKAETTDENYNYTGKAVISVEYTELNYNLNGQDENNVLRPASEAKTGDKKFYMLAYGDEDLTPSTLGFYWGADEGAAFESRPNSAYLALPKATEARGFSFSDDTEALESIEMNTATTIYTLNGVKVNELQKGLNIVNGKKVMVK